MISETLRSIAPLRVPRRSRMRLNSGLNPGSLVFSKRTFIPAVFGSRTLNMDEYNPNLTADSNDLRADLRKFSLDSFVSPIEMIDARNLRGALGDQTRED